jgi:Mg2+/Co2+ transporter CorB
LIDDVPLGLLFSLLVLLLLLSAFFSGTETALMSLNRYRLRHQARSGQRSARIAEQLLQRPDRLIGLILLGNNLVNVMAASLVTLMSLRLGGEAAVAAGTFILTLVLLIFAEVAPKTIAALNPPRLALPAALVYYPLLKVCYPFVWTVNIMANGVLRLLGVRADDIASHSLSAEELKTVVAEAGAMVPRRHQRMLLSILDLEQITVDDVMVPRQEIVGIDLDDPWPEALTLIRQCRFSRLPIFRSDVDNIAGVVQLRKLLPALASGDLTPASLLSQASEPYFVPEGTPLNNQLLNFQRLKQRFALVVDEYGDIQGLVTMEDILSEIVGEFSVDVDHDTEQVRQENANTYIVSAGANVRELNRIMNWHLPTDGPKTLNGLIIEQLETIPKSGTGLQVADYLIEILNTSEHVINTVRVTTPALAATATTATGAH